MYTDVEQKNKSIFKTYLIYFVVVSLFVVLRILVAEGLLQLNEDIFINNILINTILQIGILFILPLVLYALLNKVRIKSVFKTCNFNKVSYKIILLCIVFGVLAFIFNIILSSVVSGIISIFGYYDNSVVEVTKVYEIKDFIADIILTAIFPAFCEEFMHRGILLQGTKHAGFKQAIYISAVCFGLAHLNINQVVYAIGLGIFLGAMAVATKSIIPSMIVHFINNFIVVYLNGARAFGWFGGDYSNVFTDLLNKFGGIVSILIIVFVFLIVLIAMALLIYLMYKIAIVDKAEKVLSNHYEEKIKLVGKEKSQNTATAKELINNSTNINLDYDNMKDIIDIILPKQKEIYRKTLKDNIFLVATIVLSGLITIFTFIWGTL